MSIPLLVLAATTWVSAMWVLARGWPDTGGPLDVLATMGAYMVLCAIAAALISMALA